MKTSQGYIVPIILIILLLILAGFFVFSDISIKNSTKKLDLPIFQATTTNEEPPVIEDEMPVGTTTADVQEDKDPIPDQGKVCMEDTDCNAGQTCFIRPGGPDGICF